MQNTIDIKQCFDFVGDTTNICVNGIYPLNQEEILLAVGSAGNNPYYKLNIKESKVESAEMPSQFMNARDDIVCTDDMLFFDFQHFNKCLATVSSVLKRSLQIGQIYIINLLRKCGSLLFAEMKVEAIIRVLDWDLQ